MSDGYWTASRINILLMAHFVVLPATPVYSSAPKSFVHAVWETPVDGSDLIAAVGDILGWQSDKMVTLLAAARARTTELGISGLARSMGISRQALHKKLSRIGKTVADELNRRDAEEGIVHAWSPIHVGLPE